MPNSFKEAVAAAARLYPGAQWEALNNAERTRHIYREMQRIDLAKARVPSKVTPAGGTLPGIGHTRTR